MFSLLHLFVFVVQATSLIAPRAGISGIHSDLVTLNNDYVKLRQVAQSWDGSLGGAVSIQSALNTADRDTNTTTTDAIASAPLTAADAQSIISYITNTLEPNIAAAVQAVYNTKSKATAINIWPAFRDGLSRLQKDTDALGNALVAITPSSKKQAMQQVFAKIHDDFNRYIVQPVRSRDPTRSLSYRAAQDAAQIKADLVKLKNDYAKLRDDANAYTNGGSTIPTWANDLDTVDSDTKALARDLTSSSAVTAADYQAIIDYGNDPLEPTVKAAMQAVVGTKAKVAATGLTATVCNGLKTLLNDTTSFCSVALSKAPSSKASGTKAFCSKIITDLQAAVNAYC